LTVVELLVIIAIVGVLAALILPAVMRAREAARRTQCANNLRQLAIAATQFEGVHQHLPNSGTFGVQTFSGGIRVIDYFQPKRSWVVDLLPFIDRKDIHDGWTFADPDPADGLIVDHPNWNVASPATWPTDIVDGIVGVAIQGGDIDPTNRDNAALSHKSIAVLVCPADPTSLNQGGGLSYVCNSGYGEFDGTLANTNYSNNWSCTQTDWDGDGMTCAVIALNDPEDAQIARRMGLFWAGSAGLQKARDDVRVTFASIRDGTSNTIMFTENMNAGFAPGGDPTGTQGDFTWAFPWTLATGFLVSTVDICPNGQFHVCNCPQQDLEYEHANAPAAIGRINKYAGSDKGRAPFPSSHHGGVIIVAFGDGSTRAISANIDGVVYCKLLSPQGGNLPMGFQINAGRVDDGLRQGPLTGSEF
jgi:type II secretory pathway pseudopilin PulG